MTDLFTLDLHDTPRRRLQSAPASTVCAFVDDVKQCIGHGPAQRFARAFLDDIREQLDGGWRSHLTTRQTAILMRAAHAGGVDFDTWNHSRDNRERFRHAERQSATR